MTGLPIVVTGMHRSGTSLAASFFRSLGVDFGDRLLAADRLNPRGYFEDTTILDFQRQLLYDMTPDGETGWADWGWTVSERLDDSVPARRKREAEEAVSHLSASAVWGWKDPRTTLLLDFWAALLPEAVFLMVHRPPGEFLDSVLRAGNRYFVIHPDHAVRAWIFYNTRMLDFAERNPARVIVFDIAQLARDPFAVTACLGEVTGNALDPLLAVNAVHRAFEAVFEPRLLGTLGARDPVRVWIAQRMPAALTVSDRLRAASVESAEHP